MLFLHGYLADRNSFAYQTSFFGRYFSVHAVDLKGFGSNRGMEYPYGLSDYAREVKEYICENSLCRPHIVAHSFGGRIAVKLAAENPELFDKIVLTGAAGLKPRRSVKFMAKSFAYRVMKNFMPEEKLLRFYSDDYRKLDQTMRDSFKKIVTEHLDYALPYVKNKTLLVYGDGDRETPIYMAKRFNRSIADSKLVIIKNAGHFCFIDSPFKFNTEVREFLLSE